MLYRFLNNNNGIHYIILPIVIVMLWMHSIVSPELIVLDEDVLMPLYKLFYQLMHWSPFAGNFVCVLFVFIIIIQLVWLNDRYSYLGSKSFLPAYIFVFIIGGMINLHHLAPVYPATFFGMFAVNRLLSSTEVSKSYSSAFESGFFLGISSLIYPNMVFFFPLIWIGLKQLLNNIGWRHILLPVIGFFTPCFLAFSYYFFFNETEYFFSAIVHNINHSLYTLTIDNKYLTFLASLSVITFIGSVASILNLAKKTNLHRSIFHLFTGIYLIALLLFFFWSGSSYELVILAATSIAALFASFLINTRKKWIANFIITIMVGILLYVQFSNYGWI